MKKGLKYIHLANVLSSGNATEKIYWQEQVTSGKITSLESFWRKKDLVKLLESNSEVKLFLDSGAFSMLNAAAGQISTGYSGTDGGNIVADKLDENQYSAEEFYKRLDANQQIFFADKKTSLPSDFIDFSFTDSSEVRTYLDDYIAFIHKYKDRLLEYVNLDIIFNAERSWEMQEIMESNGLRPIPVFHYGEDYKWLKKYAEEYDYIGIGGVGTGLGARTFERFADMCFELIMKIKPSLKVHGFAITKYDFVTRWPWHSVDSTTWLKYAAYGNIFIPRQNKTGDGFDYSVPPKWVSVSDKILITPDAGPTHFAQKWSAEEQEKVMEWVKLAGVEFDYVEMDGRKFPVLSDCYRRQKVNVFYFTNLLKFTSNQPYEPTKNQKTFF